MIIQLLPPVIIMEHGLSLICKPGDIIRILGGIAQKDGLMMQGVIIVGVVNK